MFISAIWKNLSNCSLYIFCILDICLLQEYYDLNRDKLVIDNGIVFNYIQLSFFLQPSFTFKTGVFFSYFRTELSLTSIVAIFNCSSFELILYGYFQYNYFLTQLCCIFSSDHCINTYFRFFSALQISFLLS